MRHFLLFLPLALLSGCECKGRIAEAFPISHERLVELLGPDDPVVKDLYGQWTNEEACKAFCDSVNPPEKRKDWKGCLTHRRPTVDGEGGAGGSDTSEEPDDTPESKPLQTSCSFEYVAKCNNGGNYL